MPVKSTELKILVRPAIELQVSKNETHTIKSDKIFYFSKDDLKKANSWDNVMKEVDYLEDMYGQKKED